MQARDRWLAARKLVDEGRYEEALQEYIWFHEHSLGVAGMAGVRLSYALHAWVELGKVYSPAGLALNAIRDRKTAALLSNEGDWNTFHDVVAINEYLGCALQTHRLFHTMSQSRPELAERCAHLALPAVLEAKDYGLAERFMGDPHTEIAHWSRHLNGELNRRRQRRFSHAPRITAEIHIYAANVDRLLTISKGRGRLAEARTLERFAVDSVKATTIRDDVAAALKMGPQRWFQAAVRAHARRLRVNAAASPSVQAPTASAPRDTRAGSPS